MFNQLVFSFYIGLVALIGLFILANRLIRAKQKEDMEKRYEEYFTEFWKNTPSEFESEEKRLAAMSHIYRYLKRTLKRRGKKYIEREAKLLIKETKDLSRKTEGHLSKLFLAANRKFEDLL